MNTQPAVDRNALITGVPAIYTYLNLPPQKPEMKKLIPAWLWSKRVPNSTSAKRGMEDPSPELFSGKSVDVYPVSDDLTRRSWRPCHIQLMVREHHGIRIRTTWIVGALEVLPKEEVLWNLMMFERFFWDAKAYRNRGTAHLPEHIGLHFANPAECDQSMSAQSIQIMDGAVVLIHDPS